MNTLAAKILIHGIRIYQKFISPLIGPRCVFRCTCSQAVRVAAQNHGFMIALKVLRFRFNYCRNNFTIQQTSEGAYLEYPDGMCISASYYRIATGCTEK